MSGQSGILFSSLSSKLKSYVVNFSSSFHCFSPHSHLQPIFPEAPAFQHPALLPGSHHRPGCRRPLLFLDVETSQTGVPSRPRPHTCKSNPGEKMKKLCDHFTFSLRLHLWPTTFITVVRFQRSPVNQTVWQGLRCPLSSKLLLMQLEFLFLSVQPLWPLRATSSVNCKQRGNVKRISSRMANYLFQGSIFCHCKLKSLEINVCTECRLKMSNNFLQKMSDSALVDFVDIYFLPESMLISCSCKKKPLILFEVCSVIQ